MLLYFVRHAESAFNHEGRIQGQQDPPLSEAGRQQALALRGAFEQREIDALYASPLRRAVDTAAPLAEALGLEIRTDERLMELHAGVFEGKLWSEVQLQHPEEAARWKSRDPDFEIPGGESRRQLAQRGLAALRAIRDAGHRRAAVVAHGGMLTAALKELLGIAARRNVFSLYNASISQLRWPPDEEGVQLVTLNEIEHLCRAGCPTRGGDL